MAMIALATVYMNDFVVVIVATIKLDNVVVDVVVIIVADIDSS